MFRMSATRCRRELIERGHIVLPDAPLPILSRDVESVVHECLAKCTIAIHLLGQHYGVTPEDSSESIPALQVRLTSTYSEGAKLERLIWMPGDEPLDERQRGFIKRVQEDPALHLHAEIIEGNLNLLKKDLIRRLNPPQEKPPAVPSPSAADSALKLYLICDARDEAAIEALEDYLFEKGIEVCLPAFDGTDADAEVLHQDNLRSCDAVVVYYGSAPKAWVDIKLRELLKAPGYGRANRHHVSGSLVAPPEDHRKERFRSHQAAVIRGPAQFEPVPDLDAFVASIKEAAHEHPGQFSESFPRAQTVSARRGLSVLRPRRADDGATPASGEPAVRGRGGYIGQRQVVARTLRAFVRALGRQAQESRCVVGSRADSSRRQPAGASGRSHPGSRSLRPRSRERRGKICWRP